MRPLVLIVGTESEERAEIANDLLERDFSVVICNGPPRCALVHAESCVLTDAADATVIMPCETASLASRAQLQRCAASSRMAVTPQATEDPENVAAFVGSRLHHPTSHR